MHTQTTKHRPGSTNAISRSLIRHALYYTDTETLKYVEFLMLIGKSFWNVHPLSLVVCKGNMELLFSFF